MNIANYITLLRLLISPLFLFIYLQYEWMGITLIDLPYVLLGLFAISEFSDLLDGYFARKFDQVTDLGKILDPMADSISRITCFLTFTQPPVALPIWLVFIFMYRDSVVSTLRTVCAFRGFVLAARPSGKIKAGVQACAVLVILLLLVPATQGGMTLETLRSLSTTIVSLAAAYTVFSGIDYIIANRTFIYRLLKQSKPMQQVLEAGTEPSSDPCTNQSAE